MRPGASTRHVGPEKDSLLAIAVAARASASAVNSPDIDTEGFNEINVGINLSAGTGGKTIVIKVQGKYPGQGIDLYEDLLSSAALDYAALGLKTLKLGLGLVTAANLVQKVNFPKTIRIVATPSDATSGTYGVQVNKLNN